MSAPVVEFWEGGPQGPAGPPGEAGAGEWGEITGALGDQADLAAALAGKADAATVAAALALLAPLASPAFTGTPTAPTPAPGTNTDQLATAAFVQAAVAGTSGSFPARPTLPATPAGLTGYHRLAGPAGLTRYPTVGESAAVDVYGTVGVGTGQIGPCAAFNGTTSALHVGAKGGFNVCGAAAGSWTITFACRPDSWPGGVYTVIASQAADTTRAWEIRAGSGGFFYLDWRDLSQTNHISELSVPAGSVPAGAWTRVAISFNSANGELAIWINGAKISTATTTGFFDYTTLDPPVNLPIVLGGRYDATNGAAGFPYWRLFTGRIEGFAVYSRVLTGAEQTALNTTDPTVPASGTTLVLDTPEAGDVSHPDGAGAGTFRVQGWWHGAGSPTGWEYTWGDPGDWRTFEPTVSGQTFAANVPRNPAAGAAQRTLAVRWANDHAVASSATAVGVGPVFVLAGQSNVTGVGTALQSCGTSPDGYTAARQTHDWRVRPLNESGGHGIGYYGVDRAAFIGSLGGDNGSVWPLLGAKLMQRYGRPLKFVVQSRGATYITHWARDATDARNPATSYGGLLLAWQRLPGAVRSAPLLLWWHGESDSQAGTTQAAYQTALNTFVTNWHADTGGKVMIVRLQKIGTGSDVGALIRAAQDGVVGSNAYAVAGPDLYANTIAVDGSGVHVTSPAELARVATLTDAAMAAAGY